MVRRVFVSICVIAVMAAGLGFAATTGRMAGTVVDNDGLALPGVTVTISSDKLIGGPQMSITGGNGGFVFNLLPVGVYRVEANLPGFQPAVAELRVALDRVANVTFNMVPEQFGGEIEVVAEVPVVDTTQVNTSVTFDQDFLQQAAVGSGGRDYLSIISQAAGVAGSGNASVYGGTAGDNSYLVDGLNTSDPLLGTFGTNFNYDAIQEISFQTGGFEAEFGQATGGIINLVTKSGGNEFSGSLDIRYRDESFIENGKHFNRDEQTSSLENLSLTFGGPILRDKLWFFLSGERVLTERQDVGAPVVRQFKGYNYIAKTTWQMTDSHRAVFKYSGDPAKIPGANSSQFITESASYTQEQGGDIYQAELNSVLSESLLLNAQIGFVRGYIEWGPSHGDDSRSAYISDDTSIMDNSYPYTGADDRDRDEYRLNMTYFVDEALGAHEFKAGVEYNDLYYSSNSYIGGGGYWYSLEQPTDDNGDPIGREYEDLNGDGYYNYYVTILEIDGTDLENGIFNWDEIRANVVDSSGNIITGFIQDSWRPISNLTIKPGIRYDNVNLDNSVGENVADMVKWQPRVGVAWDIMGDAKHVVRGSWGRFMDPTALSIPNFATGVKEVYHEYNSYEYYCNRIGLCDLALLEMIYGPAIDWTSAEGNTYQLFDNRPTTIYDPAQTLDQMCRYRADPNSDYYDPDNPCNYSLDAPYADEWIVAYETQIAPETSIELTYINKKTRDIIEDSCSGNTWIVGEADLPSLEDSGTWTMASECSFWMIGNVPIFYRDYQAAVFKFETRKEFMHLQASYTWSESDGNTANGARQSYATALADYYPVHFYNREGWMPDHRSSRIKMSGYFLLPYDFTIGLDGYWSSEGRLTVTSDCEDFDAASDEAIIAAGGDPESTAYCYTGDGAFLGSTDIFLTERGAVKSKSTWQMDLQVSKAFHVGRIDMTAVLAIYNLFDRELDRTFNSTAFLQDTDENGDPLFDPNGDPVWKDIGAANSYLQPRRYELGFRIEF